MRSSLVALVLSAALVAPAISPTHALSALSETDATALSRRVADGDAAARSVLLESVARRDAEGEYALARLVYEGRGFAPDAGQARRLAERAATRGHVAAQNMLGFLWQHGLGGERDLSEARRWFDIAAGSGNADAQVNLGWLYQEGLGVARDAALAAQWYQQAAGSGSAAAAYNLGVLNEETLRNAGAAAGWYEKAATGGIAAAAFRLAHLLYADKPGPRRPVPALRWYEAALAQAAALKPEWILEAAYHAALLRLSPAAGTPDSTAALAHFRTAAALGHAESQYRLAMELLRANAAVEAMPWLRKAAEQKHPAAMLRYAQALERGEGLRADGAQALEWYRRSADLGDAEALFSLGRLYESGNGTAADSRRAMQYFVMAADKGHAGAKQMLASIFGPPPDPGARDRSFGATTPFGLPSAPGAPMLPR